MRCGSDLVALWTSKAALQAWIYFLHGRYLSFPHPSVPISLYQALDLMFLYTSATGWTFMTFLGKSIIVLAVWTEKTPMSSGYSVWIPSTWLGKCIRSNFWNNVDAIIVRKLIRNLAPNSAPKRMLHFYFLWLKKIVSAKNWKPFTMFAECIRWYYGVEVHRKSLLKTPYYLNY